MQLYTLRDHCTAATPYAATLKKVRAIGYPSIEISGVGPIPPAELRSIAEAEGLVICSTHESGDSILNEPARVADRLALLGCNHVSYPFPAGVDLANETQVRKWIARLDAAGAVLRGSGITLAYHNHAHEFTRCGSELVLEMIFAGTAPEHLASELDTYWVQAGGGDPVAWCRKLRGRMPVMHWKDYAVDATGCAVFAEIGSGNLDFPAILAAAEEAGCQWFVVEQDVCPGDAFDSIRKSFDYVHAHLLG